MKKQLEVNISDLNVKGKGKALTTETFTELNKVSQVLVIAAKDLGYDIANFIVDKYEERLYITNPEVFITWLRN